MDIKNWIASLAPKKRGGRSPASPSQLLRNLEGYQRGGGRHLLQLREERRQQDRRIGTPTAGDQDVLLPIDRIGDDAAAHPEPVLKLLS
jgi:hypothetical protein